MNRSRFFALLLLDARAMSESYRRWGKKVRNSRKRGHLQRLTRLKIGASSIAVLGGVYRCFLVFV
jgi:hypothetical protein